METNLADAESTGWRGADPIQGIQGVLRFALLCLNTILTVSQYSFTTANQIEGTEQNFYHRVLGIVSFTTWIAVVITTMFGTAAWFTPSSRGFGSLLKLKSLLRNTEAAVQVIKDALRGFQAAIAWLLMNQSLAQLWNQPVGGLEDGFLIALIFLNITAILLLPAPGELSKFRGEWTRTGREL